MKCPALILTVLPLSVAACELKNAEHLELQDGISLFYQTEPLRIAPLQHFLMNFKFCHAGQILALERFRIDAVMPLHGHGMNYRARVQQQPDGSLEASGLLFHMPGLWQVNIDFQYQQLTRQVSLEYKI